VSRIKFNTRLSLSLIGAIAIIGWLAFAMADSMVPQYPIGIQGPQGGQGPQGTAATMAVGTVSTLAAGAPATVTNVGTPAAAVINFGIPAGAQGATGATGVAGAAANAFGSPNALSPSFATPIQCTDPTRPCVVSTMVRTAYTISVAGTAADTVEMRIGNSSTNLCAASSPTGTSVATFEASLTGIAISIGMAQISRNQLTGFVPVGWYWCLRRVVGSAATIQSATDQPVG
jgi:hypothetical protein